MIFELYCALLTSGQAAISTLLGGYLMHYAGARQADLGFIFMIHPLTIFFRPLICAHADRRQIHRQMLAFYALLAALAYVPFISYPFCFEPPQTSHQVEGQRAIFWLLMTFHLIGGIGFCGVRSLGDALAVNYAKRIGTDFARFRKYGSISYGLSNFLVGFINQDWLLPSYVPALSVFTGSMLVLALLVLFWPHEYFEMSSQDSENEQAQKVYIESLPSAYESLQHVASKICCCNFGFKKSAEFQLSQRQAAVQNQTKQAIGDKLAQADGHTDNQRQKYQLTVCQQLRIFGLLLKRDFRIVLYLLIIVYGGLAGYSGPNFVFTYINLVCTQRGTCNSSELSGLVMFGYCVVETTVYLLVDKWGHRFNRTIALEITFLVLTFHYNFYGFALDHLSPYFFLVESLHGIEYGISLTTSVNLGYCFAREVELLLPELTRKGIIGQDDDLELVKVSLMATMSGCYTLAYDGIGCILGCLLFGLVLGNFGFNVMWISIGAAAAFGFLVILIGYAIGKCFGIRPQILYIRDSGLAQSVQHDQTSIGH